LQQQYFTVSDLSFSNFSLDYKHRIFFIHPKTKKKLQIQPGMSFIYLNDLIFQVFLLFNGCHCVCLFGGIQCFS